LGNCRVMPLVISEASLPRNQVKVDEGWAASAAAAAAAARGGEAGPSRLEQTDNWPAGRRCASPEVLSGDVQAPTLAALCVRFLKTRVEELRSVQWLPLAMVEEVLDKATAAQLRAVEEGTAEDVGRDLASETGALWKALLERDHRAAATRAERLLEENKGREVRGRGWRAMYERAEEERAEKLKKLQGRLRGKYEEQAKGKPKTLTTSAAEVTHDQLRARRRKAIRESGGVRGRILQSTGLLDSARSREALAAKGGGIASLAARANSARGKRAAGEVQATTARLHETAAAVRAEASATGSGFSSRPRPGSFAPQPLPPARESGVRRIGMPVPRLPEPGRSGVEPGRIAELASAARASAAPGTFSSIAAQPHPPKQRRVITLDSLRKKGS